MDSFQGVGESKLHGGTMVHPEQAARETWTIEGKKVPAYLNVPYAVTDQGKAEEKARLAADGRLSNVSVSVTRDKFDNQVAEFRDRRIEREPWESKDPMREAIEEHVPAGMRGRFLGDKNVELNGMRGWQPLLVDDGHGGKVHVKVGGQTLAVMPEEKAQRRDTHFRAKAEAQMVKATDELQEQAQRLKKTANRRGVEAPGFETYRGDAQELSERESAIEFADA